MVNSRDDWEEKTKNAPERDFEADTYEKLMRVIVDCVHPKLQKKVIDTLSEYLKVINN